MGSIATASPLRLATALRIATTLALLYSAVHFAASGIRQPFDHPNLAKFEEHASPLREHLATGEAVHSRNPAQYGPVFFFVMHPLLGAQPGDEALAAWLYAIQLLCMAGSFLLTAAALKPLVATRDVVSWPLIVAWMGVVWLNFSPLYTILALKSVETWELFLVSLGLFAYLRGWRSTAALAIAAGGLIKILPFAFAYYWLITDRRMFLRVCVAVAVLLLMSQLLYGSEMGIYYLPRILTGAAGNSYGLDWHENISLKAALAKLFGTLPPPSHDAAQTSGYFIALTGWRRTVAVILGDVAVLAGIALVTWSWLRTRGLRAWRKSWWEWSLLTVVMLILSPNTIFEYATLGLGAISYALVGIAAGRRRSVRLWLSLVGSLLLLGGLVPRQLLNRLTMIESLNQWTGNTHLTASEAYQYYCFPLVGLVLLVVTIWRLRPAAGAAATPVECRAEPRRSE